MELLQKYYGLSLAIRSAATHQEHWLLGQYKASCGKTPRQHGRSLCTMARAMQVIEDNQLHEAETTWSSSFKSRELFFFLKHTGLWVAVPGLELLHSLPLASFQTCRISQYLPVTPPGSYPEQTHPFALPWERACCQAGPVLQFTRFLLNNFALAGLEITGLP